MDELLSLCHCMCSIPHFLHKAGSHNGQVNLTSTLSPCIYTSMFHKLNNHHFHPNLWPSTCPYRKILHSMPIRNHNASEDWIRHGSLHSCYGSSRLGRDQKAPNRTGWCHNTDVRVVVGSTVRIHWSRGHADNGGFARTLLWLSPLWA